MQHFKVNIEMNITTSTLCEDYWVQQIICKERRKQRHFPDFYKHPGEKICIQFKVYGRKETCKE